MARRSLGVSVRETRNAVVTVERSASRTVVVYEKKPAKADPLQMRLFG